MIHSDVEPISPPVYSSELAGGEQATRASGAGDGGDPSSAEGELVESPESEVQQQAPIASPTLPSQSERMEHRITHLPLNGVTSALKASAANALIPPGAGAQSVGSP